MFLKKYITDVFKTLQSVWSGLRITARYFFHPKEIITEQYPNNRATLKIADRFKGEVYMWHNENNEYRCTGCTSCELACPNGSIKVITKMVTTPEGKRRKMLDTYYYHLEMCTMCGLCVEACPSDAIFMRNTFEHSVFDRRLLVKQLNHPGSKFLEETK